MDNMSSMKVKKQRRIRKFTGRVRKSRAKGNKRAKISEARLRVRSMISFGFPTFEDYEKSFQTLVTGSETSTGQESSISQMSDPVILAYDSSLEDNETTPTTDDLGDYIPKSPEQVHPNY